MHVGDFGLDFPGRKRGRYEKKLNMALAEREMMLIVSVGNHDNHATASKLDMQDDGLAHFRSNIKVLPAADAPSSKA